MSDKINFCALCNNVAKQKCSACQEIYYCNREHQKMHWKIHLKKCQPCKVAVNAQLGRHFIATRDIKVGEVVLREKKPLVMGPLSSRPVCLGCDDILKKGEAKPCFKCGWPLCINCTKHGPECDFTMKHRKEKVNITEYEEDQPIYTTILIIRALALRESKPEVYKELLSLEDHLLEIATKPNIIEPPENMAFIVKNYYKYEDVAEAEIAKIFAIAQINGHTAGKQNLFIAVYGKSSYVEHNCRANCSKSINADGEIIHWAAMPISKGDHISISYVEVLWSTMKRREFLARTKFIDCTCERCKDPTEFETMFSAFKCSKEGCTGFLLPPTFLESKNVLNFVCTECNRTVSSEILTNMELQLNELLCDPIDIMLNGSQDDPYNKLLKSYGRMLHENNFIKVRIDLKRIELLGRVKPSNKELTVQIACLKKLIELIEIIAPADHALRVNITSQLHQTIVALELRQPKKIKWKSSLAELKELREKVYKLLQYNSSSAPKVIYELELAAYTFNLQYSL